MAAVAVACSGMGEPDRTGRECTDGCADTRCNDTDWDGCADPSSDVQAFGGAGAEFRGGLRLH